MSGNRNIWTLIGGCLGSIYFFAIESHGGILPWATDPQTHKKVILLGQRSYGADIGSWTDFGGLSDPGESNRQTALRECDEETMGLLDKPENIAGRLYEELSMVSTTPRKYRMYIVPVYYRDAVTFKNVKDALEQEYGSAFNDLHIEPANYTWVFADDLFNAIAVTKRNTSVTVSDLNGNRLVLFPSFVKNLRTTEGQQVMKAILEQDMVSLRPVVIDQCTKLQHITQLPVDLSLDEFRQRADTRGICRPQRRLRQLRTRAQRWQPQRKLLENYF